MPTLSYASSQRSMSPLDMPTDFQVDTVDHAAALRTCLGALDRASRIHTLLVNKQNQDFDSFVDYLAPRLQATPCQLSSSVAAEITATCTAFHASSSELRVTLGTLTAVRQRLNEKIAEHAGVCGSAAACIFDEHVAELRSELTDVQLQRDDTQSRIEMLLNIRAKAAAPDMTTQQWASTGFGSGYTPPPMSRQATGPLGAAETVTEEYRDVQITTKSALNPLNGDPITPKTRKR